MNLLYPKIGRGAIGRMAKLAGLGALIAGAYGIVHDQITFTLSSEYFTEFKFYQFHYADFGLPDRVFVGIIGFLATWWVGMIAGWALARLAEFRRPGSPENFGIVLRQFPILLAVVALFGLVGYFLARDTVSGAHAEALGARWGIPVVEDSASFLVVGWIHNFGYLGSIAGLVVAGIRVWKKCGSGSG